MFLLLLTDRLRLRCRYQQFKGALEKLDSKLASSSSLPIVYMWEHPMSGPVTKCAPCNPLHASITPATFEPHHERPVITCACKDSSCAFHLLGQFMTLSQPRLSLHLSRKPLHPAR